jgi:hypothetical protein
MIRHCLIPVLGLLAAVAAAGAAATTPPADAVEKLISQLGSSNLAERRQAQAGLTEIVAQPHIYPLIKNRADDPDPEVRTRIREVLSNVGVNIYPASLGLQPETKPLGEYPIEEPIVADADIVSYDWDAHALRLTTKAYLHLRKSAASLHGFVIAVGKNRCYAGLFAESIANRSFWPNVPVAYSTSDPGRTLPAESILIVPASRLEAGDIRANQRLLDALALTGRLKWTEGLETRLRADKVKVALGEELRLYLDVTNRGREAVQISHDLDLCQLEVDGQWYGWDLPVSDVAKSEPLAAGAKDKQPVVLPLGDHWRVLKDGPTAYPRDLGKAGLRLAPGQYTIRAALQAPRDKAGPRPTVISNPLEIEVLAPDKPK